MKKITNVIGAFLLMTLLTLGVVSATQTTLSDPVLTMDYVDVQYVEFCLSGSDGQQDIMLIADPVCRDVDGEFGCQEGDADATGLFTVTPLNETINDGECALIMLETTIMDEQEAGVFYYTVNGQIGETTIGSETGTVNIVPEFGVIAALFVLGTVGVFIYRRRN
jgi:hypothetical protein